MRIKKVSQTTPTSSQIVDGYSESTTDGYSANYINGIRSTITASFNTNHTIATTNTEEQVNLDTSVSIGSKLTLSNSEIVIGSGVRAVLVSANINYQTITAGVKYVIIKQNGTTVYQNTSQISARTSLPITPSLVEVQEGDKITLYLNGTQGDVIRRNSAFSNITVEVVE